VIADLRGGASLRRCGSEADRQAYLVECKTARRAQTVRFAVAPRDAVTTPAGKIITAGSEIRASDLHGGSEPAWRMLRDLVEAGRVLEADGLGDDSA
jgi:hypothetical protein